MKKSIPVSLVVYLLMLGACLAEAEKLFDYFVAWENFCRHDMAGDVILPDITDKKMRGSGISTVFKPIKERGYDIVSESGVHASSVPLLNIQSASCTIAGKEHASFRIHYTTTTDKSMGGLLGLSVLTSNFSTMMRWEPWFQQYKDGPGDVCIVLNEADVTDVTKLAGMTYIYFSRDNVAVRVMNVGGGDILAFAKLLDECILASSIEEPTPPPVEEDGIVKKTFSIIEDKEKQSSIESAKDITPSVVINDDKAANDEPTTSNLVIDETQQSDASTPCSNWRYVLISIAVLLLLCTIVFFKRKRNL